METSRIQAGEYVSVLLVSLAFGLFLVDYGYVGNLSEYDLYSHAIGLWDGRRTGEGLDSPLHYSSWLNFGYIQLAYLAGGDWAFVDRRSLVALINGIGFVSTIAIVPLCWLALRLAFGAAAAIGGLLIFILSPTFLDVAGGGHPVLPALALFLAGASALFLPAKGTARVAMLVLAALLLAGSLMVRMELVFAFPLLVLVQPAAQAPGAYVRRAAETLAPCVVALATFFIVRRLLLGNESAEAAGAFLAQWYKLSNLGKGAAAAALAAGLGSWALFCAVLAAEALRLWRAGLSPRRLMPYAYLAGPVAIVAVALLFWLPNPLPARHFLLATLAISALVAAFLAQRFNLSRVTMAAVALVAVGLNQAAAEAMAPVMDRLSPSELAHPIGVLAPAPAGDAWNRRMTLRARAEAVRRLGQEIADARCHADLVVISEEAPALVSAFFEPRRATQIKLDSYGPDAFTYTVREPGRQTTFVQSLSPLTILDRVSADPRFAGAAVIVDPYTRLAGQPGEPPPGRREPLSCRS